MSEYECIYVCVKIFNSGHSIIGESGTFDNPAGLALTLSIAISMIMALLIKTNKRWTKVLLFIGSIPVISILLITNSRTGLICLALNAFILLCLLIHHALNGKGIYIMFLSTIAIIILISTTSYVTYNKRDSTIGRKFILEQSLNIIKKNPIIGYGSDGFQKEYMLQQAKFFKENSNSIYTNNADEVRYPMNEYVYLWINYGICGPFLLAFLLFFPFLLFLRKKGGLIKNTLLPLIPVIIFSFFSYPFHYQASWLVLLLIFSPIFHFMSRTITMPFNIRILSVCIWEVLVVLCLSIDIYYEYQWQMAEKISFRGYHKEALNRYGYLHRYFHDNSFFLYSYAMAAFRGRDMQTAYNMIHESGLHWNGYSRELLSGDICLFLNKYEEASEHFREAHHMCPVRFAPLEGLYKVYNLTDNDKERDSIAEIIATKNIKVESSNVERIKETCR